MPHLGSRSAVAMLLAVLLAGCGAPGPSQAVANAPASAPGTSAPGIATPGTVATVPPAPTATLTPAEAALAYGLAPTRDPRITYQPDVVFIEGGPSATHWASGDGLTWAIDRTAPGAADLGVGKVMFATSVALGRVAEIDDRGEDRVVTLAPISLTDLVRDGDLEIDQDLDLSAAAYHQLPADMPAILPDDAPSASPGPGPSASPGSSPPPVGDTPARDGTTLVTLPVVRLAAYRPGSPDQRLVAESAPGDSLTFPTRACPELGIDSWSVEACVDPSAITLTVDRKLDAHFKFGGVLKLPITKLHFRAGTVVRDGQVVSSGGLLEGIDGIEISLQGGVAGGAQDNARVKLEVPVEIETGSLFVYGIPMKMLIEAKFTVETAFSGKNSTLSATGSYQFDGPIGIVDGKPVAPQLSVRRSMLDSLSGITIGASGMIFAAKFKYQGGIGLYGFTIGPYVTLTASVGIGQGSVIGSPIAECKDISLGLWVGAGAGSSLNGSKLGWLVGKNSLIGRLTTKVEEDLLQYQVFNRRVLHPNDPICNP